MIGIDGNVATGKTTLARRLSSIMRVSYTPEYPPHPDEHAPGDRHESSAWRVQEWYLAAERRRALAASGSATVLDRSIVSQAAHVFAAASPHCDLRADLARYLTVARPSHDFVLPGVLVLLRGEGQETSARLTARESGPDRMHTAPRFAEGRYLSRVEDFLGHVAGIIPASVLRSPACPTAEQVAERVRELTPLPGWPRLRSALLAALGAT